MDNNQWQELCEWADCIWFGFRNDIPQGYQAVYEPHEETYNFGAFTGKGVKYSGKALPPQDMNTLFKWMVPKLSGYCLSGKHVATVVIGNGVPVTVKRNDPFEALAQAVYEAVRK